MKKTYNPLKMWGSWVGAMIYLIYGIAVWKVKWFDLSKLTFLTKIFPLNQFMSVLILLFILGFLMGWLIHMLLRYFLEDEQK